MKRQNGCYVYDAVRPTNVTSTVMTIGGFDGAKDSLLTPNRRENAGTGDPSLSTKKINLKDKRLNNIILYRHTRSLCYPGANGSPMPSILFRQEEQKFAP